MSLHKHLTDLHVAVFLVNLGYLIRNPRLVFLDGDEILISNFIVMCEALLVGYLRIGDATLNLLWL